MLLILKINHKSKEHNNNNKGNEIKIPTHRNRRVRQIRVNTESISQYIHTLSLFLLFLIFLFFLIVEMIFAVSFFCFCLFCGRKSRRLLCTSLLDLLFSLIKLFRFFNELEFLFFSALFVDICYSNYHDRFDFLLQSLFSSFLFCSN